LHGLRGFLLLLFFFLFVFLRVVFPLRVFGLALGFLVVALLVLVVFLVFIFIFVFVGSFFLVALRCEGRSFIRLQGQGENTICAVVIEALIELAAAGEEIALGEKEKIFAFGVEDRIRVVIEAVGDLGGLLLAERIEEHLARATAIVLRVGDPLAVGRPAAVGNVAVFALIDLNGFLVVGADPPEAVPFVPIEKFLAVRCPGGAVAVYAAVGGDAHFVAAHLGAQVKFVLAGLVREVRDPLAIRRPGGVHLVNAGVVCRERAGAAMLGRNGENVAAGFDDDARGGGRQSQVADIFSDILEFRARFDVFAVDLDGDVAGLSTGEVEFIEQAAIFVDDGVGTEAGPLDVVLFVVGELFCLLRAEVVAVEIHHAVAVADEIDGVAVPHGEKIHARRFR